MRNEIFNHFRNKNILVVIKNNDNNAFLNLTYLLEKRLRNSFFHYIYYGGEDFIHVNKEIRNTIENRPIDILICCSHYFFDYELLYSLQGKVYRIKIEGDDLSHYHIFTKWYAQFFDLNITVSSLTRDWLESEGNNSYLIPLTNVISPNQRLKPIKRNGRYLYDVSFVGRLDICDRQKYIDLLKGRNYKLKIVDSSNRSNYYESEEMKNLFNESRINLNFTKTSFIGADNLELNYDPSASLRRHRRGRIYEILSENSFCLSEYADDLKDFFRLDGHIGVFDDQHDFLNKVDYYLQNEKYRLDLCRNGFKHVNTKLNSDVIVDGIISKIWDSFGERKILHGYVLAEGTRKYLSCYIRRKRCLHYLGNINFFRNTIGVKSLFSKLVSFAIGRIFLKIALPLK